MRRVNGAFVVLVFWLVFGVAAFLFIRELAKIAENAPERNLAETK